MDDREKILHILRTDRRRAHQFLFAHRHEVETPDFHYLMIDDWHGPSRYVLEMAYRGSAKSTVGEEAVIISALFGEFRNCVILGESQPKANERLAAIKYELENNDHIGELFGNQVGATWNEDKIVLPSNICIQAIGRGQSLRGTKHLIWRPDFLFIDDYENEEAIGTPEARQKTMKHFMAVVRGAMAPKFKARMTATPLEPEALAVKLLKNPDWKHRIFPVKYRDAETGEWRSTWPAQRTVEEIDALEAEFRNNGAGLEFMQEYMMEAQDPATKAFTADMMKREGVVRTHQPVMSIYDPARTVKEKSANTGVVHGSWSGNRLLVWEAYGHRWMPNQIIDDMFAKADLYGSAKVGVEEHGLHEFLMQPLRSEQVRRKQMLPLTVLKPPKGKDDFIRSLQPFFKAHEIVFVGECDDLEKELLSFPTGRKDIANALAYFLKMRPGQLVYEGVGAQHIVEDLLIVRRAPAYLVFNAARGVTAAVLLQFVDGSLHIIADYVRDGDPGLTFADIVQEAQLEAGGKVRVMAGPKHFEKYETIGMRAAARQMPVELHRGGPEFKGREEIRTLIGKSSRGVPALQISQRARWVLNGFLCGYAFAVQRDGTVSADPEETQYSVLMECLETFGSLLWNPVIDDTDSDRRYATGADGRRYVSAHPGAR